MAFYVVQFLTGLASAASLFLVASGLSIIFGVTRIVNFAQKRWIIFVIARDHLRAQSIQPLDFGVGFFQDFRIVQFLYGFRL